MIIRAIDSNGDWQLGQGLQDYLRDEPAIELNLATRIKCFLADAFWAVDVGIDWWNLLGSRNPTAQAAIVLAVRKVIAESYGVVRINSVEASTDRTTRALTVIYNVDTIFSQSVIGTVQP